MNITPGSTLNAVKTATPAWYCVEIQESNGNIAYRTERAFDADEARDIARNALQGTGDKVLGAEFHPTDIRNRLPNSECKNYVGMPHIQGGLAVYVVEPIGLITDLNPRLDLVHHSPTGFAWGYGGSGPAQLALAVLADALGDDERALALYQPFKRAVFEPHPQDKAWTLSVGIISAFVTTLESLHPAKLAAGLPDPSNDVGEVS